MSYPTKSEINQQSKKDNDVIVLNIYNSNKEYNENENNETNQTEANLKIEDNIRNYPAPKPNSIINNNNNNIVFYDNTRQNPYPYSENRGVYAKDDNDHVNKNKFSKSFNPYKINDLSRNKNNINDVNFNKQNQNQLSNENIMIKPKENSLKDKKKKTNPFAFNNIGLFILCLFIFPPCSCLLCYFLFKKRKMEKEEEKKNNN